MYRGLNDETAEEWKYKDISHYGFSSKETDGTRYTTLQIERKSGEQSHLTIAPEISIPALRSFLRARGIQEHIRPKAW